LQHLIETYGYAGVLVGALLEGETIVVLGGFAAHQEHLRLPLVVLAAFVGSASGDQLWYQIGRRYGRSFIDRRPKLQVPLARATRLLERHPNLFILGFRFIYGFRNVAPVAVALSQVPTGRFVVLNLVAAALWSVLVSGAGYFFGQAVELMLGDLRVWEERLAAGAVLAILTYLSFRLVRAQAHRRPPA
jgi:membrane protein DedA with SNARE-associated domain